MAAAFVTDHIFPSLELQKDIFQPAGFGLHEVQPVCCTEKDVLRKCADADLLLAQFAPVTRRVLQGLPRLKGIVRYGVDVDNIDLEAARDLHLSLAKIP